MNITIRDTTMLGILLLEPCNFTCPHCLRSDEPMATGYRLTTEQLRRCLADCKTLESIEAVHFSGGEPTLWREGGRDLVDLLLLVARAGYTPWFTTNGSAYLSPGACGTFLRRYFDGTDQRLVIYLSVDTFHGNLDPVAERAPCLDALAGALSALSPVDRERLEIRITATISRDPSTLLPAGMVEHYRDLGMSFHFGPLTPMGLARERLAAQCPDLSRSDPEALGAYAPFHESAGSPPPGAPGEAHRLVLIGEDYYLPLVGGTDATRDWPSPGSLGQLPDRVIQAHRTAG